MWNNTRFTRLVKAGSRGAIIQDSLQAADHRLRASGPAAVTPQTTAGPLNAFTYALTRSVGSPASRSEMTATD